VRINKRETKKSVPGRIKTNEHSSRRNHARSEKKSALRSSEADRGREDAFRQIEGIRKAQTKTVKTNRREKAKGTMGRQGRARLKTETSDGIEGGE